MIVSFPPITPENLILVNREDVPLSFSYCIILLGHVQLSQMGMLVPYLGLGYSTPAVHEDCLRYRFCRVNSNLPNDRRRLYLAVQQQSIFGFPWFGEKA